MNRGAIYWADLAPRSGSEQRGRRPVIVVSHDGFNQARGWRSVVVVPVSTSARQADRGPTAVWLAAGSGGLPEEGVAVCHQVTTLDRAKLGSKPLGRLGPQELAELNEGLRVALDLG